MSISLVVGANGAAVQGALTSIVSKLGATLVVETACSFSGKNSAIAAGVTDAEACCLASKIGAHSSVTAAAGFGASSLYSGAKTTVIRALAGCDGGAIALRDKVDIFPANGINAQAEDEKVLANFKKSVEYAVAEAKRRGVAKVTVSVKPVTKFKRVNALMSDAARDVSAGSGVSVEFQNAQTVHNNIIMFPENLGVVISADTPAAEVLEDLQQGIQGGAFAVPRVYTNGSQAVARADGVASAVAGLVEVLKASGNAADAAKLQSALGKAIEKARPANVEGGKASDKDFAAAVVAAL
jgi:hypothetical protein